jgi:hypothetical protein
LAMKPVPVKYVPAEHPVQALGPLPPEEEEYVPAEQERHVPARLAPVLPE